MSQKVRRLFADFAPKHYHLNLEPNPETLKVTGSVTISGQKTGRPSQRLTFHQNDLKVTSAKIIRHDKKGDREITPSRIHHHKKLDEVRLHADELLYPGQYTVHIEFEGKVQPGMQGIYYSDYTVGEEKKRLVSTQLESHFARQAFPCIDEPEAKATFALQLITPAGQIAVSNMPVTEQQEQNGKLSTTFETTPKMSSYLLAFAFGDMQKKSAKTQRGIEVNVYSTKAHPLESLDFALDVSVKVIDFYEEYFDTPYPLPKCDHVAIPDFSAAAMENWGLITYREMALLADPKTVSQSSRELIVEVIAHEISHQWFGNLVTMKWWNDLWLNESFANVMAFVAEDKLFPEWKIWNNYIATDGLAAIRRDSIAGVQSIKIDVKHPSEIGSIFDPAIVYAKGGRLIYMLMRYLGQDIFRKGLKVYFEKHAYSNTTGSDLWEALAIASKQDVTNFMEPWLSRSGFPVVKLTQNGQDLVVEQSHFLMDPTKADPERVWPVPLLSETPLVPTLLDKNYLDIQLKTNAYARVNQGAVGHYVVHYVNPEHSEAIAKQAAQKALAEAERLVLLNDSSMLARAGLQSFGATLQLLEHYESEDAEPVWSIIALILADCRRFIDIDEALEEPIKQLVQDLISVQYKRLGWQEGKEDSSQDVKLRALIVGLGVYSEHPAITKEALALFETYKKDEQAVPAEIRSVVFGAAVRNKAKGAFDYLIELEEKTSNTNLKQDILDALTATKDETQAMVLLGRLKDSDKVRQHDVDRWLAFLLRNRYTRILAWNWLRENWPWIEKTFVNDHSYDYFPRYAASAFNSPQLLNEYKEFFTPLQKQVALARSITLGVEEIENRVAWLQRDVAAVKTYLAS